MRAAPAFALLLCAGAAPAADRDPLAGRVAGAAVECIRTEDMRNPVITRDGAILYRQSGRRIWRTGPQGRCAQLRAGDTLIVELRAGLLCRNDRFRTISPGTSIPSGACLFDRFVPYDRP